jgi:putative transposon-encoded protein
MKIVEFHKDTELKIRNIRGFMKRKVVISGTSAKINVPKEYLGCDTYLVILKNGAKKEDKEARGDIRKSSSKNRRTRQENLKPRQDNKRTSK